jgi:hypothetical protein
MMRCFYIHSDFKRKGLGFANKQPAAFLYSSEYLYIHFNAFCFLRLIVLIVCQTQLALNQKVVGIVNMAQVGVQSILIFLTALCHMDLQTSSQLHFYTVQLLYTHFNAFCFLRLIVLIVCQTQLHSIRK